MNKNDIISVNKKLQLQAIAKHVGKPENIVLEELIAGMYKAILLESSGDIGKQLAGMKVNQQIAFTIKDPADPRQWNQITNALKYRTRRYNEKHTRQIYGSTHYIYRVR